MVRLNLGSGDHPAPGPWINVDVWHGSRPQVVADLRWLPWPDRAASHVYCGHVLEHVEYFGVLRVLREARRILEPGGLLCVVGPDFDRAMLGGPDAAPGDPSLLAVIRDGGDRWPGDRHRWLSTETATLAAVRCVFPNAEPVPVADLNELWPVVSRVWWQFAITCSSED